eukprot:Selendium_serpulae@DN6194_c5_g1_i1.p1
MLHELSLITIACATDGLTVVGVGPSNDGSCAGTRLRGVRVSICGMSPGHLASQPVITLEPVDGLLHSLADETFCGQRSLSLDRTPRCFVAVDVTVMQRFVTGGR